MGRHQGVPWSNGKAGSLQGPIPGSIPGGSYIYWVYYPPLIAQSRSQYLPRFPPQKYGSPGIAVMSQTLS